MALTKSPNDFTLSAGKLYYGAWSTPGLIGTNNVAPSQYFTGVEVGHIPRGTLNFAFSKAFAEAREGTPSKLIRKDPTQQDMILNFAVYNFTGEHLKTLMVRRAQLAYSITTPTTQTVDLVRFGTSPSCQTPSGWLLQTFDTNCPSRTIEIGIFYGLIVPTDQSITLDGDNFAQLTCMVEATPHPDFTTLAQDQDNLGYWMKVTA